MKKFDYYVGIDVSKLKLDITFFSQEDVERELHHRIIDNNEKSIDSFLKSILKVGIVREKTLFCFEDTGIYSMPLACRLCETGWFYWQVAAIEIKRSKGITRGKTDKSDSRDIAFYAASHQHKLCLSCVSPKSIQKLRLLYTERERIIKGICSFARIFENKGFIDAGVYKSIAVVNTSIVRHLKKALKKTEEKLLEIIVNEARFQQQFNLLKSIPGIGMYTAIYLIVATKGFECFDNWRQLACYAGVAPFEYSSGSSIRGRTRVSHLADKKLKSLLNMCAITVVRHDMELKTYYQRKVAEGKPKMLVLNNVRCKLLARAFAVVNRNTPFVNTYKFAA